MQKLLVVNKPVGLTPLQVIQQIKIIKPELTTVPITYAGRLDPLAHGVLLLLIGEETKQREKYLSLHKTYEFELVLGLKTDTYDLLGLLTNMNPKPPGNVNIFVNTFVNKSLGKHLQTFPPYSSKPVNGKPLFWWTKSKRLSEIEIPQKEIEIFDFNVLKVGEMSLVELKQKVFKAISMVKGDFRQNEIINRWNEFFKKNTTGMLTKITLHITCSSGTYVRELVNQLGEELGCGAITTDILRTSVGEYTLKAAQDL